MSDIIIAWEPTANEELGMTAMKERKKKEPCEQLATQNLIVSGLQQLKIKRVFKAKIAVELLEKVLMWR